MITTSRSLRAFLVLPPLLFFSSCTTTSSLSPYPPYKDVVGTTVTLKRPAVLGETLHDRNGEFLELYANPDGTRSDYVLSYNRKNSDKVLPKAGWSDSDMYLTALEKFTVTRQYFLYDDPSWADYLKKASSVYPKASAFLESNVWLLPAGTQVTVERADNVVPFAHEQTISVLLSLTHPTSGERIQAGYTWGDRAYLHRAPWEDDAVPEKRFVGDSGRKFRP